MRPTQPLLLEGLVLAHRYWEEQVPCNGRFDVQWRRLSANVQARAEWRNTRRGPRDGVIVLNSAWRPPDEETFLETVIHEYGHLLGHPHCVDAASIMYPHSQEYTGALARELRQAAGS